jgi:DNA topoisomerase III
VRLIIAEKPSLARAIAAALPGQHRRSHHYIQCGEEDVVAWCAGHVLEMAPPEDYSPTFASWTLEALPIVPERWLHRVSSRELVDNLARLLAKASRVVHAGDPDREGQLLVDEVLIHLGWRGPTERLLVTDLSPAAVRRALGALEPNERYRFLYDAALARQRADWLYGLNLTRLYTLRARLSGYRDVLSVGRVQTPVLGCIVRRDRDIENFVPKPYYVVRAALRPAAGDEFFAHWAVGKEGLSCVDEDGRLLDRSFAASLAAKVSGQVGRVVRHEQTPKTEEPPLPYSLADLQVDAGRKLGWSAAHVLEVAQRLYERQLLTYPRSDCRYLPEAHFHEAPRVLDAVAAQAPGLGEACAGVDRTRRGRAWADAKITAHHAIIPTGRAEPVLLEETEQALYELVARRYVQQFLPPFECLVTRAELVIADEPFVARGRQELAPGWKVLEVSSTEVADEDADSGAGRLPPLQVGDRVTCPSVSVLDRRTQSPKAFTDASLIQAMCGIGKFVADPKARKILQDTDGIGTPATRAAIVETLFERRYVERRGKTIRSTNLGRALIDALPTVATTPDMTAVWESAMRRINDRQLDLARFLGAVTAQLAELVIRGKGQGPLVLPQTAHAAARAARPRRGSARRRRGPSKRSVDAAGRTG